MLNEIKTDEKIDMNKAETQLDEKYVQSLIRKTFDEHLGLDQDGDFCGYNLNGGKGSIDKKCWSDEASNVINCQVHVVIMLISIQYWERRPYQMMTV